MKNKSLIIVATLLFSGGIFAQKDQIKAAEKLLKSGNSQEAVKILNEAESLIENAQLNEKSQYYFVKGNALLDLANKNIDSNKNLSLAGKAYQEVIDIEKKTGKSKYTTEVANSIFGVKSKLISEAINDSKAEKDDLAAKKLYEAYLLDKKDTINLYYAASSYLNAKDYDKALNAYKELKNLKYSGKGTYYYAMNKMTSQEDLFNNLAERDKMVKMGTHELPRNEVLTSKRGEIYKNMALILVQQGKVDEAKKALEDARKANPEDTSLTLAQANLYLETKDYDTYKKLAGELLEKNPNDTDLVFNLGVISANAKNAADAEKYYKKVIEMNPNYTNAYINMAALKLEGEKPIIDEMNKLGTSPKETKRYEELKVKRENLFKETIPYLKKAVELDPSNKDTATTLMNVYKALDMTTEYKALKAKM